MRVDPLPVKADKLPNYSRPLDILGLWFFRRCHINSKLTVGPRACLAQLVSQRSQEGRELCRRHGTLTGTCIPLEELHGASSSPCI